MSIYPRKNSVAVRFPIEDLAMMAGGEWSRRVKSTTRTTPTDADWAAYRAAAAHLEAAREYEGFDEGCSCDHAHIDEPTDRVNVEYAETDAEWTARIMAKVEAGEWPEPYQDRTFVKFNISTGDALARAIDRAMEA